MVTPAGGAFAVRDQPISMTWQSIDCVRGALSYDLYEPPQTAELSFTAEGEAKLPVREINIISVHTDRPDEGERNVARGLSPPAS